MVATARLVLTLPVGGDSMALGDNVLSDAYAKIDDAMGAKFVAALGTISPVFPGKIGFDTVKQEGAQYLGSAWGFAGGEDNVTRGLDQLSSNAAQTDNSGSEIQLITITYNVVSGRKYLLSYQGFTKYNNSVSNKHSFKFRWAAGGSVSGSSTLIETHDYNVISNGGLGKPVCGNVEFNPGITGQVTVGIYWNSTVATGRINPSSCNFEFTASHWGI